MLETFLFVAVSTILRAVHLLSPDKVNEHLDLNSVICSTSNTFEAVALVQRCLRTMQNIIHCNLF